MLLQRTNIANEVYDVQTMPTKFVIFRQKKFWLLSWPPQRFRQIDAPAHDGDCPSPASLGVKTITDLYGKTALKVLSGRFYLKKFYCEAVVKQLWQVFRICLYQF